MKLLHATAAALSLCVAAACGRDRPLQLGRIPAATRTPAPASAARLPREGGQARLYRIPSLEPSSWTAADKMPPLERPVGADPEQGLIYALDREHNVIAVDLETRRVRPYLEHVRYAAVGPDGALYAIDTANVVTQVVRRAPVRFRSKLQGTPAELHGTVNGSLLARVGAEHSALEMLGSDQPPVSTPLPQGPIASSFNGDLIASAADSAVVLYDPQGKRKPRPIRVSGHARDVLFSPSGHRLYVAREARELTVIDRFTDETTGTLALPGPAQALRGDEYGAWLLVRPEHGDSVWVIDVGRDKYVGSVAAEWGDDLPAIAAPNTLLLRRGKDVAALDLTQPDFPERGRVAGGAGDFWLALRWRPALDVQLPEAADSSEVAQADSEATRSVYLQVSSSQNPTWATELGNQLRQAGLPASVLAPHRSDESYRVVLGPYATREQAESTGRKIGMPSFVITPQDTTAR